MRHVGPVRVELGTRTLFNLLGPLANPAGVRRQLLGVPSGTWMTPLTEALRDLGSERVWAVHGSDGLDEITTTGPSEILALEEGRLRAFTVAPEDVGLARSRPEDLRGADPEHNAVQLRAALSGEASPYRDIAVLNAGAALVVAGAAATLVDGVNRAGDAVESGAARATLAQLVAVSNGRPV
jgi:anthranilate phosphoribosyltransferase